MVSWNVETLLSSLILFQVVAKGPTKGVDSEQVMHSRIKQMLDLFKSAFRLKLPDGLPPKRLMGHAIDLERGWKPTHHPLHQPSPEEKGALKDYIEDLQKNGMIRRIKWPHGSTCFFV